MHTAYENDLRDKSERSSKTERSNSMKLADSDTAGLVHSKFGREILADPKVIEVNKIKMQLRQEIFNNVEEAFTE